MLFEPSRDVKLRFSKERVLEFECELSERLKALSRVESEIIEVGKLRHSWLNCVSQIDSRVSGILAGLAVCSMIRCLIGYVR